ncbi:MAG: PAS domain S-box protein [Anaerolineaceae bacterium]|nr:PAS domain S-box protein [Anaerolineaceae bacterium]
MKVQYRLLILWLLLGILFLAGFFALQRSQINRMEALVAQRRQELELLFSRILELEGQSQSTLTFDYTYWDELVDFVSTVDSHWADTVLNASLTNYNVHAIWVYDLEAKLVNLSTSAPGQVNGPLPLSDDQIIALFANTPYSRFSYMLPDGTAVEVHGATIHPSSDVAHATAPRGYFFTGRLWNQDRLNALANLSGANLKIVPTDQIDRQDSIPTVENDIVIFYSLLGLNDETIGYVEARFPNSFFQGYTQAQQRDFTAYLVFVAVFFLASFIAMLFWMALPLNHLSTSLAKNSPQALQPLLSNHSEFGHIARLIKEFFGQKTQLQEDLRQHTLTASALQLSEERYRTISELISDAAFSFRVTPDLSIIPEWGTEGIARISGYDFAEMTTPEHFMAAIHPEDLHILQEQSVEMLEGKPVEFEIRIFGKDGGLIWLRENLSPVLGEDGKLVQVVGAAQDITKRKQAEEAFHTLVNRSPQGLTIIQEGEVLFVNPAMIEMTGYTHEDLVGLKIEQIMQSVLPESNLTAKDFFYATGDTNPLVRKEVKYRHRDGSSRWVEASIIPITFQSKPAFQISCIDITGRRLAQQALEDQQNYSSKLLDMIHSLVILLDGVGRIVSFNPATERLLAKTGDDIHQRNFWELFKLPPHSPLSEENFAQLVDEQRAIRDLDLLVKIDERPLWLSWSISYLGDHNNNLNFIVLFGVDITERKLRERQQSAIASIATVLRSRASRSQVLETVLREIRELAQVETSGIGFRTADQQYLFVEAVAGLYSEQMSGRYLPIKGTISEHVLQTGRPHLSHNLQEESPATIANVRGMNVQSILWYPLSVDLANLGILILSDSGLIQPDWLTVLQPVAEIAASAIHRTTLSDETQRRLQHLTALHTINIAIGASLDLRMTLHVLANQITTQLGVDAVDILMLNPHNRTLEYAAGHGFHSKEIEKVRMWVGEGQAGGVALERRSRRLYDPDGIEGYFVRARHLEGEGFIAYHAVPLVVKGEVKGVIETFHRPPYMETGGWQELLESLALETAIAIDNAELVEKLQRGNLELQVAYDATIEGWARALELRDQETEGHTRRVAFMTVRMSQAMGILGNQLMHIRRGALLHDIGKMGIPDSILLKPGKLDEAEWEIMRQHPRLAHEMLVVIPFLRPALDIPLSHHERWDGQGYPQGLSGEQIPLAARIFTVIDVWDALSNPRVYRPYALPEEEILTYLRENAGSRFDPQVVDTFLKLYPILSRIE